MPSRRITLGMRLEQRKRLRRNKKSAAFAVVLAPTCITTTPMAPPTTFNAVLAKELASLLRSGIFAVNALPTHNTRDSPFPCSCTLCSAGLKSSMRRLRRHSAISLTGGGQSVPPLETRALPQGMRVRELEAAA